MLAIASSSLLFPSFMLCPYICTSVHIQSGKQLARRAKASFQFQFSWPFSWCVFIAQLPLFYTTTANAWPVRTRTLCVRTNERARLRRVYCFSTNDYCTCNWFQSGCTIYIYKERRERERERESHISTTRRSGVYITHEEPGLLCVLFVFGVERTIVLVVVQVFFSVVSSCHVRYASSTRTSQGAPAILSISVVNGICVWNNGVILFDSIWTHVLFSFIYQTTFPDSELSKGPKIK